jgi:hypothetical protein
VLEERVAKLLHQRLGYYRLIKEEVPPVVYLDEAGSLFSEPIADAARILRFKLIDTNARAFRYSVLLHDDDFQFTASQSDEDIALAESGDLSERDRVLLERLLQHLETASDRQLVRRPKSTRSFWQRLLNRR